MLKKSLPPIYEHLLPVKILNFKVQETKATCSNCNWKEYQPNLKCCTFEPYLPNYLIGALLQDPKTHPQALGVFSKKLKNKELLLPIGTTAPISYQVSFNSREPSDFGNRADWLCPYYIQDPSAKGNTCSVWKYRGSVCSTFFCQSSYGKKGKNFWSQLNDYLSYVEMALMEESLVYLDFSPRQISACLDFINRKSGTEAELKTNSLPAAQFKKLWNGYDNDPLGFYVKTYKMVQSFDRKHLKEVMGEMGAEIQKNLMQKMAEI